MVQDGRDLVQGRRLGLAAQVDRPQAEVAQPGQGSRPVDGVHQDAHVRARRRRVRQGERDDHAAPWQLAETSAGHAGPLPL